MIIDFSLLLEILPEAALKMAAALLCGSLLGVEREMGDKPAGLRTIILITLGATLFMIISDLVAVTTRGPEAITQVDTSRIASQVVSGIGFLGGGAIIQARGAIHGLTTAATIWVAAGIGLCIGIGFPLLGIGITLVVLAILVALYPVRAWLSRRGQTQVLELLLPNDVLILEQVKNILGSHDLREEDISVAETDKDRLLMRVIYNGGDSGKQHLLRELASMEGVQGGTVDEDLLSSSKES